MRSLVVVPALVLTLATAFAGPAVGMQTGTPSSPFDDPEHECLEPVPESASAVGVSDDGSQIEAETLVLLDGISKKLGAATIEVANESYAPLAIELVPRFRAVRFQPDGMEPGMDDELGPTGEAWRLIDESKATVGGLRPKGIDLVLTLTNKDLYLMDNGQPSYGIAGVADCIGGVRYDDHSFAISEAISPYTESFGEEFPGAAAAHELGHLFGAHHHYGNCAEGDQAGKPCTLMWTLLIQYASRNFGTLEAVAVRGHAVDFAD